MDWPPAVDPFLLVAESDSDFRYDKGDPKSSSVVLMSARDQADSKKRLRLKTEESWKHWFSSQPFIFDNSTRNGRPSGYSILLSTRAMPLEPEKNYLDGDSLHVVQEVPAGLLDLPFSAHHWRKVTGAFWLHSAVRKAVAERKCYSTFLRTKTPHGEDVETYTGTMSAEFPDNLAISSTYFAKTRSTLAVIYGCSRKQMNRVKSLLEGSPEVSQHPLLIAGVFAELQRDRLEELVQNLELELDSISNERGINRATVPVDQLEMTWQSSRQVGRFRRSAMRLEEEAKVVRRDIQATVQRCAKWNEASQNRETEDYPTSTKRFQDRLGEIDNDIDGLMFRCRDSLDELTYAKDLFIAESTKTEARKSGHSARTSTVIAFVAMLYLPTTSVATIFAMPVFNFQSYWYDVAFRGTTPSEESGNGQDSASPNSPGPVLSGYFWIYLAVSVVLTAVTILSWYGFTRGVVTLKSRLKFWGGERGTHDGQQKPRKEVSSNKQPIGVNDIESGLGYSIVSSFKSRA